VPLVGVMGMAGERSCGGKGRAKRILNAINSVFCCFHMAIENAQSSLMTVRIHWSGVNDSPARLSDLVRANWYAPCFSDASMEELIPPNLSLSLEGATDLLLYRFLRAIPCWCDYRSSCKPAIHVIADQVSQDVRCVHTREFLLENHTCCCASITTSVTGTYYYHVGCVLPQPIAGKASSIQHSLLVKSCKAFGGA
jgi:hypothetical protein